ncbi:protein Red [Corynascus novoguineensis]|uniref:Protein Red n=1 Tax=Corynascus novoguineensis TaxID=1126955 RepID=A0AAN7HF86_9PEZI|nr:protein Red [Corynascus novoguineensis]
MNNEQFRRLLLANAAKSGSDKNGTSPTNSRPTSSTAVALGSKLKSSIPMTPRSVAGARVDFAKQLAERNQSSEKPQKRIRSSAPKGSRFAEGYVDRARTREEEEEDERAERLKNLEESFKKEEIDRETYERLRNEIAGGDLSSTHLVKGLDFKLLERIRRGEDVYGEGGKSHQAEEEDRKEDEPAEEDPDDALEKLESTEVKAIERERVQKKGQFAPTALNPRQKRTRNQILAEWKAARAAAAAAKAKEESSLGSKFKKIGEKKTPGTRIERDSKGCEVLIIVDEDGHERRKVRKLDPKTSEELEKEKELLASGKVLGMEVPELYKKQLEAQQAEEDSKEISIFDDAGSDYDPLAGLEGSDEESSDEEGETKDKQEAKTSEEMPPPPKPEVPAARNYFKDSKTALTSEAKYKAPSLNDPAFLAALKKAKAASAMEKSEEEKKAAEREERLKKKLADLHRDDEDMDMGFGSSRVEDEADLEETKVKLSAWDEDDDDGRGGGGGGGKSQRKRGGKKKKGDKNNFEDVMKVIQRQKGGG